MWTIPFNDYDEKLLVWKYSGKIQCGLFRNKVSAPQGFDVVVKQYNGELKVVREGSTSNLRKIQEIFFVRKRTANFTVQNSIEVIKNVASLGAEIEIVEFVNVAKKEPNIGRLIKWVGE